MMGIRHNVRNAEIEECKVRNTNNRGDTLRVSFCYYIQAAVRL